MSILKIACNPDDWANASGINLSTTRFEADYSDYAISFADFQVAQTDWLNTTPTGVVWIHYVVYTPSQFSSQFSDGLVFDIYDDANQLVVRMDIQDGNLTLSVHGNGSSSAASLKLVSNTRYIWDFEIDDTGAGRTVNWYSNGGLLRSATVADKGTRGKPVRYQGTHSDIGGTIYYSQFIVRDNDESTLGIKVATLKGDAAGFYTDGRGSFAELDDIGVDGVELSNTQKYSYNLESLAVSPTAIKEVAIVQRISTEDPTLLQNFVRISSVDYTAAAITIDPAATPLTVFAQNPATVLPWTEADITALEVGFEAQA